MDILSDIWWMRFQIRLEAQQFSLTNDNIKTDPYWPIPSATAVIGRPPGFPWAGLGDQMMFGIELRDKNSSVSSLYRVSTEKWHPWMSWHRLSSTFLLATTNQSIEEHITSRFLQKPLISYDSMKMHSFYYTSVWGAILCTVFEF